MTTSMHSEPIHRPMVYYGSRIKDTPSTSKVSSTKKQKKEDTDPNVPVISTKGGVKKPFPVKLMDLLTIIDTKEQQLASIISWQPSGESFKVGDKKRFEKEVQSRFFTQTNYTSFRRQLNLWGFKRIEDKKSEDCGAYFHPQFKRSDKYGCRLMRRPEKNSSPTVPKKKSKSRKKAMKEARRVSVCSKKEEVVNTLFTSDFEDTIAMPPQVSVATFPMNMYKISLEDMSRNHLTSCSTSLMNRSQDHDLNFIANEDSNPIILEDELEPIVDEKECVLPYEAVVLFLNHAMQESDYFQTSELTSNCLSTV